MTRVRNVLLTAAVLVLGTAWAWFCLDVLWPAYLRSMR